MTFVFNDGGRSAYFKQKNVQDCVCRAISIATGLDYKLVYDELARRNQAAGFRKSAQVKLLAKVYEPYLNELGFVWVKAPVLSGRKARPVDLPQGVFIAKQAKHVCCVKDGVAQDTFDSSSKMVYGYWAKAK